MVECSGGPDRGPPGNRLVSGSAPGRRSYSTTPGTAAAPVRRLDSGRGLRVVGQATARASTGDTATARRLRGSDATTASAKVPR